jgi:tetratricopeptide (TPR) repeat protein
MARCPAHGNRIQQTPSGAVNQIVATSQLDCRGTVSNGRRDNPGDRALITVLGSPRGIGNQSAEFYATIALCPSPQKMVDWKEYADETKSLLGSKEFSKAQERIQAGLEKIPGHIDLLAIATDVYRAANDYERSLEHAQLLITHHPDNWFGYGRAADDLVALKRLEEAQAKIQDGLEKIPNQIHLLAIATDVYRAANDYKRSLDHAQLLIIHHPDSWFGYERAADDLVALKRFEEAEIIVEICRVHSKNSCSEMQRKLRRRRIIYNRARSMKLRSGRDYPTFCIAGNCQSYPMAQWISESFPFSKVVTLPQYHHIQSQSQIDEWIDNAISSDFVFMIPVSESYRGFRFGSGYISSLIEKERLILYPSLHLEVFFPFFSTALKHDGSQLAAADLGSGHQYGDYHDYLAMALSTKGQNIQTRFFEKAKMIGIDTSFRSTVIMRIAIQSLNEFRRRYPDFIGLFEDNITLGIFHAYNHPRGSTLNEVYKCIWENHLGLEKDLYYEYKSDPLDRSKLPIPAFVSKLILSNSINVPWKSDLVNGHSYVHESPERYEHQLRASIGLYQDNPQIVAWNKSHTKLIAANHFLIELGI